LDLKSGRFATGEYKTMQVLKRQYPARFENIVESDEFLETRDRFLVLDASSKKDKLCRSGILCPHWVASRLLTDPRFVVRTLGKIEDNC
jgi:hypothetical protein